MCTTCVRRDDDNGRHPRPRPLKPRETWKYWQASAHRKNGRHDSGVAWGRSWDLGHSHGERDRKNAEWSC